MKNIEQLLEGLVDDAAKADVMKKYVAETEETKRRISDLKMSSDGYHAVRALALVAVIGIAIGISVVAYHMVEVYESTELKRIVAEHPQAFQTPVPQPSK